MQGGCVVLELYWITVNKIYSLYHTVISHTEVLQETEECHLSHMHASYTYVPLSGASKKKKIVTVSVTLFLSNLVRSGLSVITYLHFSSGFGGVLNLSRLSVENQMAS